MWTVASRLKLALAAALLLAFVVSPLVLVDRAAADGEDVDIDEIDKVKRGKERVQIRAEVGEGGLTCQLKIKYADGNADSPDDVVSNKHGICEMYFTVPDRRTVVGEAIAKLNVVTKKGGEYGKTSKTFMVRDRRS